VNKIPLLTVLALTAITNQPKSTYKYKKIFASRISQPRRFPPQTAKLETSLRQRHMDIYFVHTQGLNFNILAWHCHYHGV